MVIVHFALGLRIASWSVMFELFELDSKVAVDYCNILNIGFILQDCIRIKSLFCPNSLV